MKPPSIALGTLWQIHRKRPFPHERPAEEYGGLDNFDLTSLDTFVAGYASRAVDGEALSDSDLQSVAKLADYLAKQLPLLSGQTRQYFESVLQIAQAVQACSRPSIH